MNYATAEQTSDLVRQATPDETWLSEQLDRIAPDRLEMGAVGDLPALNQLVIEAAPDLLAACRALLSDMQAVDAAGQYGLELQVSMDQAHKAIAKATGVQP